MFITPTEKNITRLPPDIRRKQNAGESTFAEEVESLLEVDAVVLSKEKKDEKEKRGFSGKQQDEELPLQEEETKEKSHALPSALNITA